MWQAAAKLTGIAHRGACGQFPENTRLAFEQALLQGAHWIELDVHHVAGRVLVVHDAQLPDAQGRGLPLAVHGIAVLRQRDCGQGQQMPFLEEVLTWLQGRAGLHIELKGVGSALPTCRLLRHALRRGDWSPQQWVLSSFRVAELRQAQRLCPQVPRALLWQGAAQAWPRLARELDLAGLHLSVAQATPQRVQRAQQQGLQVRVYTANTPAVWQRLQALGVDGVFSDFPAACLAAISHHQAQPQQQQRRADHQRRPKPVG